MSERSLVESIRARRVAKAAPWLLGGAAAGLLLATIVIAGGVGDYIAAQYGFGYQDGFVRRGLLGQCLRLVVGGMPSRTEITLFAVAILVSFLVATYRLIMPLLAKAPGEVARLWWLVAVFSPATVPHIGYDFGRADLFNLLLTVVATGMLLHRRFVAWVPVLVVLGTLAHEAFLFMNLPLLIALMATERPVPMGRIGAAAIAGGLTAGACVAWGALDRQQVDAIIAAIPVSPGVDHDTVVKSACVFLKTASTSYGCAAMTGLKAVTLGKAALLAVTTIGLAGAGAAVWGLSRRHWPLLLAPFGVVPMFALGVDYGRWCTAALITALLVVPVIWWREPAVAVAAARGWVRLGRAGRRLTLVAVAGLALLGPIGSSYSFPLFHALNERRSPSGPHL